MSNCMKAHQLLPIQDSWSCRLVLDTMLYMEWRWNFEFIEAYAYTRSASPLLSTGQRHWKYTCQNQAIYIAVSRWNGLNHWSHRQTCAFTHPSLAFHSKIHPFTTFSHRNADVVIPQKILEVPSILTRKPEHDYHQLYSVLEGMISSTKDFHSLFDDSSTGCTWIDIPHLIARCLTHTRRTRTRVSISRWNGFHMDKHRILVPMTKSSDPWILTVTLCMFNWTSSLMANYLLCVKIGCMSLNALVECSQQSTLSNLF